MQIPFFSFEPVNSKIKPAIIQAFEKFYDNAWYVLGEEVKRFEKQYAAFNQVEHAVGISNGSNALHIALKTLDIGPGDEVIVPAHTFIASVLAISYVGATPVFVEPDIKTYNIDPDKVEAAITSRTKVILPVHLYGQACNMAAIMTIAEKHNLFVIEDNAQAQGATFKGKLTGSFGQVNATSFYPTKNLGALGDAGVITTNNAELTRKAEVLRNYGSEQKYYHETIGYNMRLDECQAAFLNVKLSYLKEWTEQRQQISQWYNRKLQNTGDVIFPELAPDATHVYHLYVIRTAKRDTLQAYLAKEGIASQIHYPIPPHLQKAYEHLGYKKGDFPIAEKIAESCLSLPLWPGMCEEQVEMVAEVIRKFYN